MIGTGVLTTSGFTVFYTQSNQLMLWLWVIGGVVAICGALTIAELAAALPRSGGDYVFLYEAYGPLVAFLSGWVSFLIGFGAPIAAISFAAATYLTAPFVVQLGSPGLARLVIASLAIVLMACVHNVGTSRSIQVQGGTTLIKLAVLMLLAVCGIAAGRDNFDNLNDRPPITFGVAQSMAFSLVFIAYSYTGWNGAAYLAGEIKDPGKQLPRAIILGTVLVILIYLALNLMFALASPAAQLIARVPVVDGEPQVSVLAPIAEISATNLFGKSASSIVSVAIGLTMMASLSAYVLTGPRVAFAMARAGHFPDYVGRLSRQGTPSRAIVLQCGLGTRSALDQLVRVDRHLRGRRPVDVHDAERRRRLRPAMEAARLAPAVPHARLPGRPRHLPGRDGAS